GQMPYADAVRMMQAADMLLLLDSPGRTIGVPAKLYEYLGAGRPILAIAEPQSDTAHVLEQSGVVHRLVSPKAPDAVVSAIAELVECQAMCQAAVGRWRFTREQLAGQLARIMKRVAQRARPKVTMH